nr:reverse transcriptase domain-containing protein [Tanacetum cinerariifolium]
MAANRNDDDRPHPPAGGDLQVLDLQTMEELCQPSLKGDDANKHLDKFLHVTQSIKVNGITDDALRLYLFPHSLTHHATAWFDRLPRNSITTFDQMVYKFLLKYFPPSMVTKLRNEITNFRQLPDESLFKAWERYNLAIDRCPYHNMLPVTQIDAFYSGLTLRHLDTINDAAGGTFMKRRPEECYDLIENMTAHHNDWDTSAQGKLHFDLSFADALLHMPKFVAMFRSLLNNKEKLFDLATTLVNENCSAVILKKLLEKLGDPGKFVIPCDFPELVECLALANLGASINLMHLSIWEKLSLTELTPIKMILELADRSITRPAGTAEDVFVKVGKFHFSTDFVVVDFVVDPRVPLILERTFLRIRHALIDVYGEELTLRVDDEAITFKVGQISKYSYNDTTSTNQIDVIDIACDKYVQEIFRFSEISKSGNPTPSSNPIVALSSSSLTPFEGGDFILEEIETYLASESIPPGIDNTKFDPEGDILLIEKLLNDDPSSPLPPKEHNLKELKSVKSSIDEPPELELKDLPSHLEYAFLEGVDKLSIIIANNLKNDEKDRLLKSPGKPHSLCPQKWCMTVVTNEENELMPMRLVTSWRVCIDYRKLNDATRKDHFPLPFMDQMLERLAGNEFYCFLDGFSSYFQIPIDPNDKEKTTFTYPYETFAYRRMPFGLCNAPECIESFNTLKKKLTEAPILVSPDWDLPFEIMCDASDFAVRAVLGQQKELLVVVYAFEKVWPYLVLSKTIVYTDHSALKYLLNKQDAKPRLLRWILLLQEFDVTIRDKKGAENLAGDHLSRLENPHQDVLENKEITKTFPLKTLGMVTFRGDSSTSWGHHEANYTAKKSLILVSFGLLFTEMPMTWSHGVTLVNVKAKFRNVMKCLKMLYKFAKSLTSGVSILWARSRLLEGTSTFSWP